MAARRMIMIARMIMTTRMAIPTLTITGLTIITTPMTTGMITIITKARMRPTRA